MLDGLTRQPLLATTRGVRAAVCFVSTYLALTTYLVCVAYLSFETAGPPQALRCSVQYENDNSTSRGAPNLQFIMVGDSIVHNYRDYVNRLYSGVARAVAPVYPERSSALPYAGLANSDHAREKLFDCAGGHQWTVITYNSGLHDCFDFEFVTPDRYRSNLAEAFAAMSEIAFVPFYITTTPFGTGTLYMNASCVVHYNAVAREEAALAGITVIDLYAHVVALCGETYAGCMIQEHNSLHFPKADGAMYLGLYIARRIKATLQLRGFEVDTPW
jgi:hypothetical protein